MADFRLSLLEGKDHCHERPNADKLDLADEDILIDGEVSHEAMEAAASTERGLRLWLQSRLAADRRAASEAGQSQGTIKRSS